MKVDALTEIQVGVVAQLVRRRTGLVFPASRQPDFEAGVRKAMANAAITDLREFIHLLESDDQALDGLIAKVIVAETYFFREPLHFELLRRRVLPELQRLRPRGEKLRFWSAGCASGEEPYSLAILLEQEGLAEQAAISGTDISRPALARASEAKFGAWSMRGNAEGALAPYFKRRGDHYVLADRLRRRVAFGYLNLASDAYPSPMTGTLGIDVIFCRNVLIYLGQDIVEWIARRLFDALKPGGWLITGPSDPPLWAHAPYETVVTPAGVFYRRGDEPTFECHPITSLRLADKPSQAVPIEPDPETAPTPPDSTVVDVLAKKAQGTHRSRDLDRVPQPTRKTPTHEETRVLRVRALANLSDPRSAEREAVAAIRAYPLSAELHYLRSIILMGLGQYDDAETSLRRVIYLDRSLAVAHFTLATVMQRRGSIAQAQRAYRSAFALCADRPKDEILPLSEGQRADRLAAAAQIHLVNIEAMLEAAT